VTAAIALAVVLLIGVVGASMAMESQRAQAGGASARAGQPPPPPVKPPTRSKGRARNVQPEAPASTPVDIPASFEAEFKQPDLVRNGVQAQARVVSVVDERTLGPVTRSRLVLRVEPGGEEAPFEVTIRHAFQTPEARSVVKVGSEVTVRYSPEDRRVVLDPGQG